MTRNQKIAFIALGVVSVLFIGSVLYGQGQNPSSDCEGKEEACADKNKQDIKRMRYLFSAADPSIKLPEQSYTIEAHGVHNVTVPEGSESMRTLKLRLESGVVHLTYAASAPGTGKRFEKQGTDGVTLPRGDVAEDNEDRNQTSFVVAEKGGTLTILCRGEVRCVVVVPEQGTQVTQ